MPTTYVSASTFKRLRMRNDTPLEKQVPHNKARSVLEDPEYAATLYRPHFFFFYVKDQMKHWVKANPQATATRKSAQRKRYRAIWDEEKGKDPDFGENYEKRSRDHNKRSKGTKVEMVQTLNRNGRWSYCSLEKAINNWCSYKLQDD
jgi:hypothetical protein